MEEKIVEENIVQKQISLNEEIIARFIGLYLMKVDIPEDIYEYVKENKSKVILPHLKMFFGVIFGAPDETNESIRKMAINFIK